jgi:hypothetical protein
MCVSKETGSRCTCATRLTCKGSRNLTHRWKVEMGNREMADACMKQTTCLLSWWCRLS